MINQDDVDRMARELHYYFGTCWKCHFEYSLATALLFKCPFCGGMILPGPITPERGTEMLAELKARRRSLGLPD